MFELPNLQLVLRPGIIDLSWGHPDLALLPVAEIRSAALRAMDRWGPEALAYGAPNGAGSLLAWLTEYIGKIETRRPTPSEIMLTGGNSHALDLLCTVLCQPGDVILVESPTYHLALRIFRDHPVELVPISSDADGVDVETLAQTVRDLRRNGRSPKLLYCVPTFNNPSGASLSPERRRELISVAMAEQLTIVEDDAYRELTYEGAAPPSLWELAPPGPVIRIGSFSKCLAPGLRLGWITADASVVQRIVTCGVLDSGGSVNHFTALVVAQLCEDGMFEAHTQRLRREYRIRRDALATGLSQYLPATCHWEVPRGGYFVWVQLPGGARASDLLMRAEANGVSFVPGPVFDLAGGSQYRIRLAFTLYSPENLDEGARRLGKALTTFHP